VRTVDQTTAGSGRGPSAPVAAGTVVLGRYRLRERVGAGGFGVVWLAEDERLGRAVAVKRIPMHDAATAARAEREGLVAAQLGHPGIVALFEAGRDDEAVYLVSELVRGRPLAELMADGALSDRDVARVGVALCDALAHAHARGVVHRDVKPGNVLVPESSRDGAGVAKLTDFGVARMAGDEALTRTGDVVGTLAYMAPEQAAGRAADAAADLYALGLVVFEGLAGVNPVRGAGAAATARRLGRRLPALSRLRGDLPEELCAAVDRTVLPRPELRGALCDLRQALSAALAELGDEPGTVVQDAADAWPDDDTAALPALPDAVHNGGDPSDARDGDVPHGGADGRAAGMPAHSADTRDGDVPRRTVADPGPASEPAGGERPARVGPGARAAAAVAAAALAAGAAAWLVPAPAVPPAAAATAALLGVGVLPRLGWLALAVATAVWAAAAGESGIAVLVLTAGLPTVALLRRAGTLWSAPALAPLLGAVALAGAWPALAGQAARAWHRAALGALGLWWVVLAEALTGSRLALGPAPDVAARAAWDDSATTALRDAIGPALTGGALALAAVWAVAAVLLPVVVRGRTFAVDLVGATMWAAALGSATEAVAAALTSPDGPVSMRGLVAGAVAAGAVAVAARASRGEA
jgi:eukaryotic-like serine/threonine-protein kinase